MLLPRPFTNSERVFIFGLYIKDHSADHSSEWFEDVATKLNSSRSGPLLNKYLVAGFYRSIQSTGWIVLD